jgi:imidazolonepropionase-like amidohydrolase
MVMISVALTVPHGGGTNSRADETSGQAKAPQNRPAPKGPGAASAGPATVIRNTRIMTAAGAVIDPGTMVIQAGRIIAIGPSDKVEIPNEPNVVIINAAGRTLIPGLVDTHSHLGLFPRTGGGAGGSGDGNEVTGPIQSQLHALDAINPHDQGFRCALSGGITAANIMPGSANLIGGQTLYVKFRGDSLDAMRIAPKDGVIGGLKMANGENPKKAYGGKGQAPLTRMKVAAMQRSELLKAADYRRKRDDARAKLAKGEKVAPVPLDPALEPLVEVLERKRTVHFHSHRADDIRTTLRLKDEFGFDLVIQHGTESYRVAAEIAKRNAPVSMTIPDSPGGKAEVADFLEQCGAELHKAGVKVIINTDDPVTESRFLLRTAAIAVRGGLPDDVALKALTLHPAQAMRIDHRVGSLEVGKDADFVVLSGEPFSVYTRVLETWIDGRRVFELANETDRRHQQGGFALTPPQTMPPAAPMVAAPAVAPTVERPANAVEPTSAAAEFVVRAGRVHTVSGARLEPGAVHVKDGKIVAVGPIDRVEVPAGVPVLSAREVSPGLIDPLTTVPLSGLLNIPADQDFDETTDPIQADIRVLDAFHPNEPLLEFLLQQGVTLVHACPGRSNVVAGQTGVFRTRGRTADEMTVRFPQTLMMNLGEAPKSAYPGRKPATRMATAALLRSTLLEASEYARKKTDAKEPGAAPDRNLKLESLGLALERKIPALITAHRAQDLETALRIAGEFKLEPIVALGSEAWMMPDRFRATKTPLLLHPPMQRAAGEELHSWLGSAGYLRNEGLLISLATGHEGYVPKTRVIRHEAAIAAVHGLGVDGALRAITLDAARILKLDDRFGSLEPGKVADLVLYDGDLFEYRTRVTHVVLGGRVVFDRSKAPKVPMERLSITIGGKGEAPCCLGL